MFMLAILLFILDNFAACNFYGWRPLLACLYYFSWLMLMVNISQYNIVCGLCVWLSMPQDPRLLASQSNEILTAIVQGMRKEEQSNRVKLAATKALLNSLEFTKANFEKEVLPFLLLISVSIYLSPLFVCLYLSLSSLPPPPPLPDQVFTSFFCLGRASFHHASCVWSHPVQQCSCTSSSSSEPGQDNESLLSVYGVLHGTSTLCSESC